MGTGKAIGTGLLVIVCIFAFMWIVQGQDFFMYKFWAPKYEDVRRETFENTKSYKQGMVQELENMQFEYVKADSAHQDALASIILHRAADFDEAKLPTELRAFIQKLRNERTGKY